MNENQLNRLRTEYNYCKETGLFTHATKKGSFKIGQIAGYIRSDKRVMINLNWYSKTPQRAHRLAWLYITGAFPKNQIDHIDHNPSNNKWDNLREVEDGENKKNLGKRKNNTSGVTGVTFSKQRNKWVAQIQVKGHNKYLGRYDTKEEAITARKKAESIHDFHANHGREVCP